MNKIWLIGILTFIMLVGIVSATTNDAVVYYSFDDGDYSSTTMIDISGATVNNGTCTGMGGNCNTLTSGILGNSSSFSGAGEYIDSGITTDFGLYGNYSFGIWVNTSTNFASNAMVFGRSDDGVNHGYSLHFTGAEKIELYHTEASGSNIVISPSGGYNDSSWHFIVGTFEIGFGSMLWVDGVNVANGTTHTTGMTTNNTKVLIGRQDGGTPRSYTGWADEAFIYDRLLTNSEIAELYNSGAGFNPYAPTAVNSTVTVTDEWDGSNVNNITVILDGTTYTNTTGNKVTTKIWTNDTSLYAVNITANNYFGKNYTNQNFTADTDLAATLHQSEIDIVPYELYSNNSISGAWCVMNGTTQQCGTQWNITAGTYNVTVFNASNYYNITKELTINALQTTDEIVEGLYDMELNLSLRALPYNTSITDGTGWLYHQNATYNYTISSTPTTSTIPWLAGYWEYYLAAEIDGIAGYEKTTTGTDSASNGAITKFYYLQNDYLQLQFIWNNETAANTSGRIILTNLSNYTTQFYDTSFLSLQQLFPVGYVDVYFNDADNWTQWYEYYNDQQTIYNETLQILETGDKDFYLNVIDDNGQAVDLAQIKLYHSDSSVGSYEDAKLIGQRFTDSNGNTYFKVDYDKPVYVSVIKDGFENYIEVVALNPEITTTAASPKTIRLTRSVTGYNGGVHVTQQQYWGTETTLRMTVMAYNKNSIKVRTNASNYTGVEAGIGMYAFAFTNGTDYTTGQNFTYEVYVNDILYGTYNFNVETPLTNELLNNITFPRIAVVIAMLVLTLLISIVFRAEGVGFVTFTILGAIAVMMNSAFWFMSALLVGYYALRWISKLIRGDQ